MFIGIDVGGTKIESALYIGTSIKFISRITTPSSYEQFLVELKKIINHALQINNVTIKCIGIGVPATVKDNRIDWSPNIPYLNGINLADVIEKYFRVKVFIANDAQLSLLGESWKGAAKDVDHAVLISIGTGVGGAIMLNRRIVQGRNGSAGAFGWINLNLNEPNDPNHGYLERHASGSAVMQIGKALDPALTSYQIIKKSRQGNEECLEIIHDIGFKLGASLATVSSILEPDLIIFSGGLSEAFDLFDNKMEEALKKFASPSTKNTPIIVSDLGSKSGVYGAVRASILQDKMFEGR